MTGNPRKRFAPQSSAAGGRSLSGKASSRAAAARRRLRGAPRAAVAPVQDVGADRRSGRGAAGFSSSDARQASLSCSTASGRTRAKLRLGTDCYKCMVKWSQGQAGPHGRALVHPREMLKDLQRR